LQGDSEQNLFGIRLQDLSSQYCFEGYQEAEHLFAAAEPFLYPGNLFVRVQ
jgi:hypothetical protein